jgi:hypothetical protein
MWLLSITRTRPRTVSRTIRVATVVMLGMALASSAGPSSASADPRFGVMNAEGGIYWRSAPDWNAAEAIAGNGFYPNTVIEVHCYQAGAGDVPGSTDYMWEQASDVGGSGFGSGWVNEHFINDGSPINAPSPGVPACGSSAPAPPAPAPAPAPTPLPSSTAPSPVQTSPSGPGLTFGVMNASGGIYWRSAPTWGSAVVRPGNGFYPGTTIHVICFQSGGTVPGSADTMWVQASWFSGPGHGGGWVNEHFVNDGAAIDQPAPGVPHCGTGGSSSHAASGVGCYGDYCSGRHPRQTGCSADAKTVASKELSGARLELRWSARCKTEWARWIQYPVGLGFKADLPTGLAAVQDTGYTQSVSYDANGITADRSASATSGGITTSWTPMIYSPVHLVRAVATIQCGSDSILGSIVDCAMNGKVQTASW